MQAHYLRACPNHTDWLALGTGGGGGEVGGCLWRETWSVKDEEKLKAASKVETQQTQKNVTETTKIESKKPPRTMKLKK